jgi:hypothetical protein
VQVVYLTDHNNNGEYRVHEMLDGLWSFGMDIYPVLVIFRIMYSAIPNSLKRNAVTLSMPTIFTVPTISAGMSCWVS